VLRVNLVAWGRVEGTVCWVAGVSLGVSVVVSVGWVAYLRVEGTVGWVAGAGNGVLGGFVCINVNINNLCTNLLLRCDYTRASLVKKEHQPVM